MTTTTNTQLLLLRYRDLIAAGVVRNRMTLYRWMRRKVDPFPKAIKLGEGPSASIAWRATDVEDWLDRRASAGKGERAS